MARVSKLGRRFPENPQTWRTVVTMVEHAVEEASTDEVRRELQEALKNTRTRA
jgi:hypothetical protein